MVSINEECNAARRAKDAISVLVPSTPRTGNEAVKSHPTPTPRLARKNDPSDVAETGGAEPQIAEQSRSWRGAIGEREVMRGS